MPIKPKRSPYWTKKRSTPAKLAPIKKKTLEPKEEKPLDITTLDAIPNTGNTKNVNETVDEQLFIFTRTELTNFAKFVRGKVYHRDLSEKTIMAKIKELCGFTE